MKDNTKRNMLSYLMSFFSCSSTFCVVFSFSSIIPTFNFIKPSSITIPSSTIPNDSSYSNNSSVYSQVGMQNAWDISVGSSDVSVAVIDSGVYTIHNDLNNNADNSNLSATFDYLNGTISFIDPTGHGTGVAGIIGAEGNNNIGVSGVCWHTNIVPLSYHEVDDANHEVQLYLASNAIDFAESNDIPIINYSTTTMGIFDSSMVQSILNYSGLFVCCAGNHGENLDGPYAPPINPPMMANADNLIVVGSLNQDGHIRSNSNYGAVSVDLFAPGESIYTTSNFQNGYSSFNDTSAATPFVAGAAALLKSINPSLNTSALKNAILSNVDVVPELQGKCVTGGKLNIYKAAQAVIPDLYLSSNRSVDEGCYNWEKIYIDSASTYSFSISGTAGLQLSLSASYVNGVLPLEEVTIESGQTSAGFSHLFSNPGYYYVRVKNNGNYKTNYTLHKTFVSFHSHSFTGSLIPIDFQYHGRLCSCGEVGMIMPHVAKPSNPYICFGCGGFIGGTKGSEQDIDEEVKRIGIDSSINLQNEIVLGSTDKAILEINPSYIAYLNSFK